MSDEINLILTKLKLVSESEESCAYICDKEHSKILYDYITNLQEEKEDYKSRNEKIIRKISLYRMDDITMESNRILNDLLNILQGEDKDDK